MGWWPWRRFELLWEQLERYCATVRRDVKMVVDCWVSALQHDSVMQLQYMFPVPTPIVCDRFACETVLEAEFFSIMDGYAPHVKCDDGDPIVAEFVLAASLSSSRWD